jgi:predicted DNA-binding protein (MmcQ/YjbR family)
MQDEQTGGYYAALRAHCAGKPGATERRRWREVVFRVCGRVFAFLDPPARPAVTVKRDRDASESSFTRPSVTPARYLGRFGWVTASAYDDASLRLACELIDRSYELTTRTR